MRFPVVAKFLGLLTGVVTLWMLWPLGWALWDHTSDRDALALSMMSGFAASGALFFLGRRGQSSDMGLREAFAAVTLSWIAASAVGALPFWFAHAVPTYTDAFFETMSGFTTTGSSVLTDIEVVPRGLLFWRSLTHWLGGMGIIVLTLAVMPVLGMGGGQLFRAEVPGPVPEKLTPRVQQTALLLWGVYVFLSLAQTALMMAGGMNLFDALTHMFGTMATGGFSTYNSSVGHFSSPYLQWVIILFMFLAGANFTLHYLALTGHPGAFLKDPEFRFYALITLGCVVLTVSFLAGGGLYPHLEERVRAAAFQVVSILTTTGFATANYENWPYAAQFLLLLLMFVGGCAGSTGGAMKNVRLLVLCRHVGHELFLLLHPRAVVPIRLGHQALPPRLVSAIGAFFSLYIGALALCTLGVCALGVDILTALSGAAATLGNIGPGLGNVGPAENYATLPGGAKWIYSLAMLMGRLELFTVAVLLHPACWRK
ncbi:TrkH family potassium uptake protein [Aminomonas paucivorans]|uniref:TrkH family potassium uptake protein n=1 Tax=Aminomonas paucivorans TaxID=81412 RepID=UPI00331BB170